MSKATAIPSGGNCIRYTFNYELTIGYISTDIIIKSIVFHCSILVLFVGTSTLSIAGTIVRKNKNQPMPDRLKIVFSNSVTDDEFNFSYLHDCSNDDQNIFNGQQFKIEWPNIPTAFDNVTFGRYTFPVKGTDLKDNFILEGRIFGVYDDTLSCQDLEGKTGKRLLYSIIYPKNNIAYADRYRVFYRRGSIENQMESDHRGKHKYLDLLRRYANDSGCDGCYGWKWFGCLADWQSQIPEGFSCAIAVTSHKDECEEVYQQIDCSNLIVKVTSVKSQCRRMYKRKSCPTSFMRNETLRNDKCVQIDEDGFAHGSLYEEIGNWKLRYRGENDLTCCSSKDDCCSDCISEPNLGT